LTRKKIRSNVHAMNTHERKNRRALHASALRAKGYTFRGIAGVFGVKPDEARTLVARGNRLNLLNSGGLV